MRNHDIGLFDPKWTATINEEWTRNLLANRPTISQSSLLRVIETMNTAAIKSDATHIVTANIKDFPQKDLTPYGLKIEHPDILISNIIQTEPSLATIAFKTMMGRF